MRRGLLHKSAFSLQRADSRHGPQIWTGKIAPRVGQNFVGNPPVGERDGLSKSACKTRFPRPSIVAVRRYGYPAISGRSGLLWNTPQTRPTSSAGERRGEYLAQRTRRVAGD